MGLVADIFNFIGQRENVGLAKEEWKLKKQQLDMAIEERNMYLDTIKNLPPNLQGAAILDKNLGGKLLFYNQLIQDMAKGQMPATEPTKTVEQTGEFFRPTAEMVQKQQPLVSQIASQQLGMGGLTPQDFLYGMAEKEFGVRNPLEPTGRPQPMPNPAFGNKMQMAISLRNGTVKFLADNQGTPLLVPEDIQWKPGIVNGVTIDEAYDKKGNRQPQFDRTNVPQEFTSVSGAAGPGNQPGTAFIPRNIPPGTQPFFIPGAIPFQRFEEQPPGGGKTPVWVNPYGPNRQGGGAVPAPGAVPGKPPGGRIYTERPESQLPIKSDDLQFYVHKDTGRFNLPVGTTPEEAEKLGFKRIDPNTKTQIGAINATEVNLGELATLMKRVFPLKGGTGERAVGGPTRWVGAALQTSPEATQFTRFKNGTLAPTVRSLGEKGNLSDTDIRRAEGLYPKLTDSADVAWGSMRRLQAVFAKVKQKILDGSYDFEKGLSEKEFTDVVGDKWGFKKGETRQGKNGQIYYYQGNNLWDLKKPQ